MRTLKIFIIAALLFLFAIPAIANTNYPPEMPDIKNAPVQFICEAPSSVFLKAYWNPEKEWQVLIVGRNQKEMRMELFSEGRLSKFVFVPSANEWKNVRNLTKNEKEEVKKYIGGDSTEEDDVIIQSCVRSHLHSRGPQWQRD